MEDTSLVETGSNATAPAAADAAGQQPHLQPDLSKLSLEQIETLFAGGSIEAPVLGGGGKTTDQVEIPPAAAIIAQPEPGATPAEVVETAPVVEEDTRTPEEIEAAALEVPTYEAGIEAAAATAADEPEGIQRPRLKDERDQLVMGVYLNAKRSGSPISFAEAEARVDGPKVEPAAEVVIPTVDYAGIVTGLEGEVATLTAELAKREEGLWNKEISDLTTELSQKQGELMLAKRDLQQAARDAQAHETASSEAHRTKAHAQAVEEYGHVGVEDDKSPFGKAVAKYVTELKNPKHPDHAILFADSAPLTIARNVAAEMGIAPVKKTATSLPAKPPTVKPPLTAKMSPAPGNATAVAADKPAEDGKAQLERARKGEGVSLAELDALQGMPDQAQLLAGAVR